MRQWWARFWPTNPRNQGTGTLEEIIPESKGIQEAYFKEFERIYNGIATETTTEKKATAAPMHSLMHAANKYQILPH